MSESQGEKRRRGTLKLYGRPRKRQARAPKEEPSDAAKQAANYCLERYPKYTARKLDDHLTHDPIQTPFSQEEAEAMALFDASQSKLDFEKFNPGECIASPTTNDFKNLWKVCLRVFEWSPVLLISPLHGLKYRSARRTQQSDHGTEGSEPPDDSEQPDATQDHEQSRPSMNSKPSEVIFSPGFSTMLFTLIVHPCWEGDAVLFLLALQFTIKCRVDNREPWPRDDLVYRVSGLRDLRSMFDDPNREPIGIAEMMNAVHNSQAEDERTTFSRFLHFLGGQVKTFPSDVTQSQTYLGVSALPVTVKDLKFLTAAVTEFDWGNDPWNCSPDEVYKAFWAKRGIGKDEVPITNADTKRWTLRSLKDAYRDIARQKRALRDGVSQINTPYRSLLDDNQENAPNEEDDDIPIDDMLLPPPDDGVETVTSDVSEKPREGTPFQQRPREREPRRKALVDGEETEDEEEDLRRNQRSKNVLNERQVRQEVRQGNWTGGGLMSGLSFDSPYTQLAAPTTVTRRPPRLMPLTPIASGETLSQRLQADEQRLENRFASSEASIKNLKEEQNRILDLQKSHSEAISNLQRHVELLQSSQAERVDAPPTNQRIEVPETQNESLVQQKQDVQKRIDQMVKDTEQQQAEWSRKVHALKLENSTLKATSSQNEEELWAEITRISKEQFKWSEKAKALEGETSRLLGMVIEKDKVITLQSEKIRLLEAQFNAMNETQQGIAPSTEEPILSSSRFGPQPPSHNRLTSGNFVPFSPYNTPNPYAALESEMVGLPSQMKSPDHAKLDGEER
ncbi:hypothetical protein F52700_2471 [Fusarium sp. NRRL 52700]|nr:hypothetical protein F52700_2471 [Fusarium sp. NRRL 52700]